MSTRRITRLLVGPAAVFALVAGMTAGSALLTSAAADAATCGTATAAGTNCSSLGTLNVTGGTLNLTSPTSLTWAASLNGTNQSVVDVTPADQQLTVNDATGTAAGWHVTTSATTFTNGAHLLPDTGTLVLDGSVGSISATTAPAATCVATCTLPTDSTTYPAAITTAGTAPTAVTIYDTPAATGVGQVVLGGSTSSGPIGWWVNVPANAFAGAYTSTITQAVVSAP
jgi:WxL domain surface cell wall-binding